MDADGFRQAVSQPVRVTGLTGYGYLLSIIENMLYGNFITEHDAVIGREVAKVLTGGDVPKDAILTETQLLTLEKQSIAHLFQQEKTLTRINGMLQTGRPVRN